MLTGHQVREACALLRWTRYDLQRKTALSFVAIDRAMRSEEGLDSTMAARIIFRDAFHRAGIEFTAEGEAMLRQIKS